MELKIDKNHSKLYGMSFMCLQMHKHGGFIKGGKYTCTSSKYGEMGVVECLEITALHLNQISKTAMLLSNGNIRFQEEMEKQNFRKLDLVHLGVFKFLHRKTVAFKAMIEGEAEVMKLELSKQVEMFSQL